MSCDDRARKRIVGGRAGGMEPTAVDVGKANLPTPVRRRPYRRVLGQAPMLDGLLEQALSSLARGRERPDSDLYAESRDADAVIKYMTARS